jgi:hypothetical protein
VRPGLSRSGLPDGITGRGPAPGPARPPPDTRRRLNITEVRTIPLRDATHGTGCPDGTDPDEPRNTRLEVRTGEGPTGLGSCFTRRDRRYDPIAETGQRAHWVRSVRAEPRVRVRVDALWVTS